MAPDEAWAAPTFAPHLSKLAVSNGAAPYAGDHRHLTTISPSGKTGRRAAFVHFRLDRTARVRLEVVRTLMQSEDVVWSHEARLRPGRHRLAWKPDPDTEARTYLLRLTVTDRRGRRRIYGPDRPYVFWLPRAPVVRVLGVGTAFANRSYAPGQRAELAVSTDARTVTVELFRCGPESEPTYRHGEMQGVQVTEPAMFDWRKSRNGLRRLHVRLGDWPSGLYFARLAADDGRVGFAPFILRPGRPGMSRVAVVLPTNTWQAYNFCDEDGDGWGDTWYAGGSPPVVLNRPHLNRGVPFRFKSYDLGFIRWLNQTGKTVDFLAEDDLERIRSGDALRALYDLVIFPGHTEYVTEHEYDLVERYRDLGGSLWFLSANNFFWHVRRGRDWIVRVGLWRDLGRPEARLLGAQYLANDDGSRQKGFVVAPDAPAWTFDGTGLGPGATFGRYGIEIDARTPHSPPGTQVLATIPDAFGPGRSAEMTYYETAAGARVFSAGALNFGGSAEQWPVRRLLENLWARTAPR